MTKEEVEETTEEKIKQWHYDRNLIHGSSSQAQMVKLYEETNELLSNITASKCIKDDCGDIMVVLINIMEREGTSIQECLEVAYNDIKDRKGKMVDGIFVKEAS